MYTLRNKTTGHTPQGCQDAPDLDCIASFFVDHQLSNGNPLYKTEYEEWASNASTDEIISEAHQMGYELYEDQEAMKTKEEDYSDYPKSEWKEDANQFAVLAIKLGLLSYAEEDSDPAEYEEQQFGDWAHNTVKLLARQNLESHLINF